MNGIVLLSVWMYQAIAYEYGQIFADIKICGTNQSAYPFCASGAAVDESPINLLAKGTLPGDRLNCDGDKLEWEYNGNDKFAVEKKEHTIEVVKSFFVHLPSNTYLLHQHYKFTKYKNMCKESTASSKIQSL